MREWFRRFGPTLVQTTSAVVLVFIVGVVFGHLKLPPQPLISDAIKSAVDLARNGDAYFLGVPRRHIRPLRFATTGVQVIAPDRMTPGVTFVTGLFGKVLGARLYANDGTLLHEWPINFFDFDIDKSYPFDVLIHGDHLYPNGDFIANLDQRLLVRVSACGDIIWRSDHGNHHSVDVDDDGFIWTPMMGPMYDEKNIRGSRFRFDKIGKFDPNTGELLTEIDLVKVLRDADAAGIVSMNNPNHGDMMHLNDVEVLNASMADAFPGFEAGDIMLSSRHFNQIWVLDGTTHSLKWWQTGPMVKQHDPDFQSDGTITMFNNRPGLAGGSQILRLNPQTRRHDVIFRSSKGNMFYSPFRGKHQVLENGNVLITETDGGRVFEVTHDGEIVWSFVNRYDDTSIGCVMSATRYPLQYAAIGDIDCN